jgi:hypothetical protein
MNETLLEEVQASRRVSNVNEAERERSARELLSDVDKLLAMREKMCQRKLTVCWWLAFRVKCVSSFGGVSMSS